VRKLVQKKRLRPSFTFEHDGITLRVTSKRMFSRNSFEIKLTELSSNRMENSSFAFGYLLTSAFCILLGVMAILTGMKSAIPGDREAFIFLSMFPFAVAFMVFVGFWKRTGSHVMLCRKDNGIVAVSFYPNSPSVEEVDGFIDEIKSIIDNGKGLGFEAKGFQQGGVGDENRAGFLT